MIEVRPIFKNVQSGLEVVVIAGGSGGKFRGLQTTIEGFCGCLVSKEGFKSFM